MRIRLLAILAAVGLVAVAIPAQAVPVGFYQVTAVGPLNSSNIVLLIESNDTFPILSALFDLSGTEALAAGTQTLVIDGPPFSEVNNTGGTATFGPISAIQWQYSFSSFDPGDSFRFNWDPDIPGDGSYGAVVAEQLGLRIDLTTSAGVVSGVLARVGDSDELTALIASPVPEPAALLLLGSGLIAMRLRRRQQ